MENVRFVDGKKFMWDGRTCESQEAADTTRQVYEADGFEARIHEDDGGFLVYTRRLATQTVAEGSETP